MQSAIPIVALDEVDSTNAHAFRLLETASGHSPPFWVIAQRQSQGRGRRARPWVSEAGNFYGTLLLHMSEPPAQTALRSFAAALALSEALHDLLYPVCGSQIMTRLSLKWPNDVLLDGAKVAGILLENKPILGGHGSYLAIGIGVNLTSSPPRSTVEEGALLPVSIRSQTGVALTPEEIVSALCPAYQRWENVLQTQGFAPLRHAWLSQAAYVGLTITARTGSTQRCGVFRGLDTSGNLILETAQGCQAISASEIFFDTPSTAEAFSGLSLEREV